MNAENELARMHVIMRKFDETLSMKCSKTVVDKIYEYTDKQFAQRQSYEKFVEDSINKDKQMTSEI